MYSKTTVMSEFLDIINQNGNDKTDGEILDELIEFASEYLSVLQPHRGGINKFYKTGEIINPEQELYRCGIRESFNYWCEPIVFGFELELELKKRDVFGIEREALATQILAKTDDVVCQRDGSLENGFEIVSQPATYSYYYNNFSWSWISDVVKSDFVYGSEIGERGLHIHINRASFLDEAHTIRFAQAIVDDVKKFHDLDVDYFFAPESVYCKTAYSTDERYCAVNLSNQNTIEVRCFAPTPTRNQILTYMRYMSDTHKRTQGEQK